MLHSLKMSSSSPPAIISAHCNTFVVVRPTIRCQNPVFRPRSSLFVSRSPDKIDVLAKASLSETVDTTGDVSGGSASPACHGQIGIVNFLRGKNYFVTGATGFLAKVLVEKLLRTVPDVKKIYVLIKANDREGATKRLKTEIIESDLFKCLQQRHGKSYEEVMMSKLIPVVGDISKTDLGMDDESAALLANEIDVIVNSAANTRLDERYDVSLNTNTRGPGRLMIFAQKCKKLCVFLHISTAYVNGERGVVTEKPLSMGESIAQERLVASGTAAHQLDVDAEIRLASDQVLISSANEKEATQTMKDLGLQRAKMHGWRNAYLFSKAMGEMVINNTRGKVPVVIVRPSVVESTYREPFPGWIQGYRVLDPLILSYGKGNLPGFVADPDTRIDVVPADMVVNAAIAVMAKHGNAGKPGLEVYHVASSVANPLHLFDLFKFSRDAFANSPLLDSEGTPIVIADMEFMDSVDKFDSYISNVIAEQSGLFSGVGLDPGARRRAEKLCKKKTEFLIQLAKVYQPYMFYKGWFGNDSTQKLIEEMSIEEMWDFGFDVRGVNWRHYLMNIHIPGLKRHVLMMKQQV